jgi:hypothetical protein
MKPSMARVSFPPVLLAVWSKAHIASDHSKSGIVGSNQANFCAVLSYVDRGQSIYRCPF